MGKARKSSRGSDPLDLARREAMEFSGIGLYRYAFDGAVIMIDRGALRIFELEDRFANPAEAVGKHIADLVVYTGPQGLMRREIREHGQIRGREWTFKTLRGTEKWVIEDCYLVRDPKTGEESIQVLTRDITARRKAEEAVREREEQYRRTLDSMADAIHLVDPDLRILLFNQAFRRLASELGLPSDAVGRNVFEVFPFLPERVRDEYRHVLETGEALTTEEHTVISGREFITETRKIPVLEKGRVTGVLTVVHDMTQRKRAEQALRESEGKYRTLVEMLPFALCIFQNGRVAFANEAAREMFRYARVEDFIGQDIFAVVPEQERVRLEGYVRDRMNGKPGVPTHYETTPRRTDGEIFPAEVFIQPVMFQGQPAQQVLVRDITEYRQAQEALREGEEKYRNILESIQEGYYEVDLRGTFTFFNRALCHIFGYSEQELLGLNYRAYYPDKAAADKAFETFSHVYDTGQSVQLADWEVVRKDGTRAFLGISISLMRDADGTPIGFRGIARDVTRRKLAEKSLEDAEARYRELFENANDIVYTHDPSGRFTSLNKAGERVSGYTREEALTLNAMDVIAPEYRALAREMVNRKLSGDEPTRYEVELIAKDGHRVPVEVSTRMILQDGVPIGVQGIARDMTDRKRAEEERRRLEAQVQHAQKLEGLGVLAGGIAHDFNNLLVGIMGYAGLALTKIPAESPARGYVEKIEASAQRAAELTNQMLAYSGRGTFVVRPLNLTKLVKEVGRLLSASISKKAILKYDCAEDLPPITGDAIQLHQVIMNLVTNASDAIGDEPGVISLSTRVVNVDRVYLANTYLNDDLPDGRYVCLGVSDTGSGMDADTVARIFDPFFTTKFAGRGLGLAAVLGIIRSHNGAVKVYSEPGHGTTFKILLPVATETSDVLVPEETPSRTDQLNGWRGHGTILIADDEEAARSVAREVAQQHGFTVITAVNGQEAVDRFRAHAQEIVAVLLDLTMPVMGGKEAFDQIRAIRTEVPVILSSGYTEEDVTGRFGAHRPAGFIQKPYAHTELVRKFHDVIAQ